MIVEIIMKCTKENFKKLRLWHPVIHLYKNYYLMRDYSYGVMGPSLWGLVKVETEKEHDEDRHKMPF